MSPDEVNDIRVVLARIDERTKAMDARLTVHIATEDAQALKFVTKPEFEPVRRIVYGMIGAVGLALLGALLSLILTGGSA